MGKWNTPDDLKYARTDEWLRLENGEGTLGVSDYAQDALNDVVFVELPEVGATFSKGQPFGVVESVKAASDLNMPVSGTITAVNKDVEDTPELINTDPYGRAWLIKFTVDDPAEADGLMDAAAYAEYCESR